MTPSHEDMAKAWNSLRPGTAPILLTYGCYIRNDGTLYKCAPVSPATVDPDVDNAAQGLLKIFHVNIKYSTSTIHSTGSTGTIKVTLPINLRQPDPPPKDPNQVRMVANPNWIRAPSPKQFADAFPAKAAAAGVKEGKVGLECEVDRGGMMSACEVVDEDPAGMGFAEAAKSLAPQMGVTPWTAGGEPVEGAYIDFVIPLTKTPAAARAAH